MKKALTSVSFENEDVKAVRYRKAFRVEIKAWTENWTVKRHLARPSIPPSVVITSLSRCRC